MCRTRMCGYYWVERVCICPSEAVEVVWGLLGNRNGGGMYWKRMRQYVGPEVTQWAEFMCEVEFGAVGVPSFG